MFLASWFALARAARVAVLMGGAVGALGCDSRSTLSGPKAAGEGGAAAVGVAGAGSTQANGTSTTSGSGGAASMPGAGPGSASSGVAGARGDGPQVTGGSGAGGQPGETGLSATMPGWTSDATGGGGTTASGGEGGRTASDVTGHEGMNGGEGNTGAGGIVAAGVRLIGRVDTEDAAGPRFAWSGTGLVACFSGTSVGVRLAGGQQYTVVLDGTVLPKLIPSEGVTPIASELAAGEHLIELYRRTEANQGESQFLGFELGDGMLLTPPPPPARRLEVIGDSITCGYGNEGPDMNCPFSPDTENHYRTYAAISARELGAELSTVAWSGKGVVCNYGDSPDSCVDPMPDYYDRILPERPMSSWDFSKFQPNAVVINLGTNDFSTEQDPTQEQFEDAYVAFLEHIRSKYSDAWILSTVGPLLTGSDLQTARTYIANAVARRAALGDTKVKAFELTPTDAADGYGCDWHPSLKTHEKMAVELTSELKATLGW